ncbi:MAG: hypothetical protein Kow00121_25920 [Elainellaceae cyanobacterium]
MSAKNQELTLEQRDRLVKAIAVIDSLSADVGASASVEIIEELYLLITVLLERYPELELEGEDTD